MSALVNPRQPCSIRRLGRFVTLLGLFFVCISSAQPVFEPPDPDRVTLAAEPVEVEGMGLRLRPPEGSIVTTSTQGGRPTVSIQFPENLGAVGVQPMQDDREPTIFQIEESIIIDLLGLPPGTTGLSIDAQVETKEGVLLGRSPIVNSADRIVRPFYFSLGEPGNRRARGVAVIQATASDSIVFNLFTTEADLERAREMFEVMLGSVSLIDPGTLDQRRGDAVREGSRALGSLTSKDYDEVIRDTPEQFERIYRPVPGGATTDEAEVGYRRIKAWIGPRDDLNTGEPSAQATDNAGYLLRIDGLVFLDDGRRADSRAMYFLSRDRRQEAWTVDMAIRGRGQESPEVWQEIGARSGSSMHVQIKQAGSAHRTTRPRIEGEGYISRLESYLLPQLLIRAGDAGEFAFYAYDQTAETNQIRFVTLEAVPERPGLWRTITRRVNGQSETAEFNEYGRLIRSESSDGLLKRPIEFNRLYEIWRAKGLPLE